VLYRFLVSHVPFKDLYALFYAVDYPGLCVEGGDVYPDYGFVQSISKEEVYVRVLF